MVGSHVFPRIGQNYGALTSQTSLTKRITITKLERKEFLHNKFNIIRQSLTLEKLQPNFNPQKITARSLSLQAGSTEVLTSVDSFVTELLLDSKNLVKLGKTLRSGGSTSLDLSGTESNNDVGDGDVLSLSRTVGDHDSPSSMVRVLSGLDRLGKGSDLVDLEEKGVATLPFDGLLDALRVGDGQVISDNLALGPRGFVEVRPGLPVILGEGVLNGDNRVRLGKFLVERGKLLVGEPLGLVGVFVLWNSC
jgi:hypothetical protein